MAKTTSEMQMVPIGKLIPYVNNARTHSEDQITQSLVWVCSSSGRPYPWEHLSPGTLLSALLPKFSVGQMLGMKEWGTALLGLCLLLPSFKTRL